MIETVDAKFVEASTIAAVRDRDVLVDRYWDHERKREDMIAPGLDGAHIHFVRSLGRGITDDTALLDWLFDHVLPMEASMDAEATRTAAELGYLQCLESGTTTVIDQLTVHHSAEAFEAARDLGIRGLLGKVLMDTDSLDGLREDTEPATE